LEDKFSSIGLKVSQFKDGMTMKIYTIGHSTRKIDELVYILKKYSVEILVDIRTIPKSKTNPQFNQDNLRSALESQGIGYIHIKGLGGLRRPQKNSINTGWRNPSFRGYADYMQTGEVASSVGELVKIAESKIVAIMCAEAVPWRCHRSLVSDCLLLRGFEVLDIFDEMHAKNHLLTKFATVDGYAITYPATGTTTERQKLGCRSMNG
jgi:uncharacterized protein (DUF488 family)